MDRPRIDPSKPEHIAIVDRWLRTFAWNHPLMEAVRKAIECRKTQERKRRNRERQAPVRKLQKRNR